MTVVSIIFKRVFKKKLTPHVQGITPLHSGIYFHLVHCIEKCDPDADG